MNQYPGFVPMMVPQPYMVAMPTAIPVSAGHPGLPQVKILKKFTVLFDIYI